MKLNSPVTRREAMLMTGAAALGAVGYKAINGRRDTTVNIFTETDVAKHLRASRTKILTATDLLAQGNAECIDGRSDQRAVGIPGGDMGDLILKIAASEEASGHECTDAEIEQIFDRYLHSNHGGFYMHTDDHGLHHAAEQMPQQITQEELEEMIADPGRNQHILLAVLTQADAIGCGHIKRMLTHPHEYPGVRPDMIRACLRKFFREKWAGNQRIDYAKLRGAHGEKAVLSIRRDGGLNGNSPVPLVQPNVQVPNNGHGLRQSSVFLLHPDVDQRRATEWTDNALEITQLPNVNLQRCRQIVDRYRAQYLRSTALALAHDKPSFEAVYKDNPEIFTIRKIN